MHEAGGAPINRNFDEMTILRVAKYYYLEGLGQEEISKRENIHRTQISRILKAARDEGYVKISVSPPDEHARGILAERLCRALGLESVKIAPAPSPDEGGEGALWDFSARYLENALSDGGKIGIGVGKTLYNIAARLTPKRSLAAAEFFSVVGSSGTDNPYLQASVILDNFARPFGGRCRYNNFPICMRRERLSTLEKQRLEQMHREHSTLDTVVLSIGEPFTSNYPYFEEFSLAVHAPDVRADLSRPHGNLLGHVIFEDGKKLAMPGEYLITSIEPETLKGIPSVICIASGAQKLIPIISAAKNGYIKTLITDEETACAILK